LDALARSYGIAAAQAVPIIPNEEPVDALTTYESLDGAEATKFYKANFAAVMAAQSARQNKGR
jgi:hypothetical protein